MELDRLIQPNFFYQSIIARQKGTASVTGPDFDLYADNKNTFGVLVRGFNLKGMTERQ
jgi:hypothetical protein